MKAVGYYKPLPIESAKSLVDLELPEPVVTGHDLLVDVRAVSVNPVDTKMRRNSAPSGDGPAVIGWDASGVVVDTGPDVSLFRPGDEVWYAGAIDRPGTNAERHLVDERIVGRKPESLDHAAAAAMPLTGITAWELLFDRLGVAPGKGHTDQSLLIVGAAGGVGSILTQLARRLTGLTVIATASRPETQDWVRELGAHAVIDHGEPLTDGLRAAGIGAVTHVASLTQSATHFPAIAELLAPQGRLGVIDDLGAADIGLLKRKSISLHWEFMFTRPVFGTPDMIAQHRLLTELAELVDAGVIRTTLAENFGLLNADNLKRAHGLIESGRAKGKVVLELP